MYLRNYTTCPHSLYFIPVRFQCSSQHPVPNYRAFSFRFPDTCGVCAHTVHTHRRFKITLPNTDQAHEIYLLATISNFSQTQLSTP